MDRMAILLLILGLLTGCKGATMPVDPFATYGPSRIPPPATGSARRTDPYYRGSLSSAPSGSPAQGIAAQGAPAISRFTSEDPSSGAVEMADRRAADTPAATGGAPSNSPRRLDWRSPTSGSPGYTPPSDSQSPRPRFPSTSPQGTSVVGLPNEPLVQQGPGATTPAQPANVPPGSVYLPNGQVAPAGYQQGPTAPPAGQARY